MPISPQEKKKYVRNNEMHLIEDKHDAIHYNGKIPGCSPAWPGNEDSPVESLVISNRAETCTKMNRVYSWTPYTYLI